MPPAFWELWNGESAVGCTVHVVTAGLDKGDVIAEAAVPIKKYSTAKGLQLALDEVGIHLMCRAVDSMLAGTANPRPQAAGGQTRTKPTLAQLAQLSRRHAGSLPRQRNALHRAAKAVFLYMQLQLTRAWRLMSGSGVAVTVILYHRVNDDMRDSLTVGVEQFDRQMAFIRRHCEAVSIEEAFDAGTPARLSRPRVCVTFDDGYADNFTDAAPILLRHQIPAAFFVSTGLMGTDQSFPHDRGKEMSPLPNMSWEQLRAMRSEGFTIGSHTVNHIDCARESEATVRQELRLSMDTLQMELGLQKVVLAYPYGGRDNMTPARLEFVKQAGYVGCLSAYGGFNTAVVDRFNILRCGVNWTFSDLAFRSRVFGVR